MQIKDNRPALGAERDVAALLSRDVLRRFCSPATITLRSGGGQQFAFDMISK
jgi:hypothetical protein